MRAGEPVVRGTWMATLTSLVVILVAGLLAGLAYGAWASRHPSWESTLSLNVSPLPDTGDPDRVIATQIEVLESRTQLNAVADTLTAPASFTITAQQRRLSDVVDVTVTSPERATATRAAAATRSTYPLQPDAVVPPRVRITVLDPPLPAVRTDDLRRDALLVGLGGAALVVAALILSSSLRPRVKRSYEVAPVDAMVLELPTPGRKGSLRRETCARELRWLADHVIARNGDDERPHLRISALAGVDDATLGWVADVLDGTTATASFSADEEHGWSVLLARAGVDAEKTLRREVGSRILLSPVVVVVFGASGSAVVAPIGAQDTTRRSEADDGRLQPHGAGQTMWR